MVDYAAYAQERRRYISEIRDSFELDGQREAPAEPVRAFGGVRLRLTVSLLLLILFVVWQDAGTKIKGCTPEQVLDLIEENRYDTILQEALAALETLDTWQL